MTSEQTENVYDALERIFHEPNRLAIMSAVCAAKDGLSFPDLKAECELTDGNLNRHLKVLQDAGAVKIHKAFVKDKPRTTVRLSESVELLVTVIGLFPEQSTRSCTLAVPTPGDDDRSVLVTNSMAMRTRCSTSAVRLPSRTLFRME